MIKKSVFIPNYGPQGCGKSVFVYGPQGCGKTSNAPALARYFGLPHWRDEWQYGQPLPATNHLILTIDDPRLQHGMQHLRRVYSFDEVMAMAGLV